MKGIPSDKQQAPSILFKGRTPLVNIFIFAQAKHQWHFQFVDWYQKHYERAAAEQVPPPLDSRSSAGGMG